MMTPERWQQVNDLFHSALRHSPDQRAAFLDQVCSGDPELRREVDSLIAAHSSSDGFIETYPFEAAARLLGEDGTGLNVGQRIGQYKILSLLGRGGMGEVYLAYDTKLGRKIALKLLPANYTYDRERVRRFEQEARAASALNHPNILTIFDIERIEGTHFIATEYIEGQTLRQRMADRKMELGEILDVASQVASALSAAHQAGIVHRDIKPENIMLRSDGYVKVLDFGLAKLVEEQSSSWDVPGSLERDNQTDPGNWINTESGLLMGTLSYMSPEQLKGESLDARTDLYSLGVVIYEMVTGRLPFEAPTRTQLIELILGSNSPKSLQGSVASEARLEGILNKALRTYREERYGSAGELLADLKNIKQELDVREAAKTRWIERYKTAVMLCVSILAVAVIALIFGLTRIRRPDRPFQNMKLTRLTNSGRVHFAANISPNGKYVAYLVTEGSKGGSVWLREVGKTSETEIVLPDKVEGLGGSITFSPDSEFIYISSKPGDHEYYTTYQVPVSGGVARRLPIVADQLNVSPDGKRIAYKRDHLETGVSSIVVSNADGTDERELIKRQAPSYFATPSMSWSPDGKMIACIGQSESDGYNSLVAVNVEDGTEKRITPQRWNIIQAVTWLPDLSGLIMTAADLTTQDCQVWHISYPGGEARRITNDLSSYGNIGITADGNSLLTIQEERQFRIWTAPVKYDRATTKHAPSVSVDMSSARRISPNVSNAINGHCWTPDGRLVYSNVENGYVDLWIMDADGSNRRQLTNDPYIDAWPSVSPDGRYVVFWSQHEGNEHIWRMDIDGKNLKQLTNGRVERDPVCSPVGNWVYYNSWDTGKATIWRVQIEGGAPEQLTESNSFTPCPSPDGSIIEFFPTGPGFGIMHSESGEPVKTLSFQNLPVFFGARPLWTPDGRALTCMAYSGGSDGIWLFPVDGGRPEKVIDFKPDNVCYFDWSSDWKQLSFARGTVTWNVVLITDVNKGSTSL